MCIAHAFRLAALLQTAGDGLVCTHTGVVVTDSDLLEETIEGQQLLVAWAGGQGLDGLGGLIEISL
jgi:hypothetical protein